MHGVPDEAVLRLALRQRGVVTRRQLVEAGLTRSAIAHRVRVGRLRRIHPAVYAVGQLPLPPLGLELAALLACGPGAVLSHLTAAVLWRLLDRYTGPVHVTTTATHRRAPDGVTLHRCRLEPTDVRTRHGLPLTSPARTLELLPDHSLDDAVDRARAQRLLTSKQLDDLAATTRRPALRDAISDDHGFTRSRAERRLKALVARAGLPAPLTNVRLNGHEVDALWPAERLIVEVDSYAHHASRRAFEDDRARDATHAAAGFRTLRVTWRQLTGRPELTAARFAAALALRPAEPTARRG